MMELYKYKQLVDLVSRVNVLKEGFITKFGGPGFIDLRVNPTNEFENWKAEVVILLEGFDSETSKNIIKIIKSMKGWHDERDFEKIASYLLAMKNQYDIKNEEENYYQNQCQLVRDIIKACIMVRDKRVLRENLEDQINIDIRDDLKARGYIVCDQTQRGTSPSGKQSGEIDLLIEDKEGLPLIIIEALKLTYLNKGSINYHINKIFGYDSNGLETSVIIGYIDTKDFSGFYEKYKKYISEDKFTYELYDINDVSDTRYSEIKLLGSKYGRSNSERKLLHLLVNFNKKSI